MPQTQPATLYFPTLCISPITSIKPHPILSDFICACVCLFCFALPAVWVWFGRECALAAEWKRRQKRSRAKTLFQLQRLHYSRFPDLLSCSIFHACALNALLLFFHIDWFPVQLRSMYECRLPVLSSRRQWWGEAVVTSLKMACGSILQRFDCSFCFFIQLKYSKQAILGIYLTQPMADI